VVTAAETAARHVSALYDFVRAGGISPKLVRKTENIREKTGNMNEGRTLSQQTSGAVLALRNGVIPVLRAAMFVEQRVIVTCHIAGRKNIGPIGFEVLIHHTGAHADRWTAHTRTGYFAAPPDSALAGSQKAKER